MKKNTRAWRAIKKDDQCRPLNVHIISQNVQKINSVFRTAQAPWVFNKKSVQTDGKSDLAAPTGFEPVFSP